MKALTRTSWNQKGLITKTRKLESTKFFFVFAFSSFRGFVIKSFFIKCKEFTSKTLILLSVIVAGLWFVACAHTSSPEATKSPREKTKQTPQESPTSASQTEKAEGQEASEKSQSSQAASRDAAKDNQKQAADKAESGQPAAKTEKAPDTKEAQDKSQSSQAASAEVAGTQQKTAAKSANSSPAASRETADTKLEEARRNLRISEATEKRIASELEELKKSGAASPETIKNYEIYHESVQEMVAENRKIVAQMEAAKARHSSEVKSSEAAASGKLDNMLDPKIPEEQTTDEVAALDRQLNASLNEFDARLLKEMDEIQDESASKMRDLAQEAAEAAKRLRERGVDVNTSGSESSETSEETETQDGEETQADQSKEGSKTVSTRTSRQGSEGSSRKEQGRAGYEDDDIVARQLREAAENETDPELKEKLWKEYEDYKKSR